MIGRGATDERRSPGMARAPVRPVLGLAILLAALGSCSKTTAPPPRPPAGTVTVSPSSGSLWVADTLALTAVVRDATGAATTFGYGPRVLHSTGQLHKDGPPVGRFLQLLHDTPPDIDIPDATHGFTRLKHAQAIGDLDTLRVQGRPAERVTLTGPDPAAAVQALTYAIRRRL
jgi:hypothetical protein